MTASIACNWSSSFLERKCGGELLVHEPVDRECGAWTGLALGVDREQFGSDIANLFRRAPLRPIPGLATEQMQGRRPGPCPNNG